MKQQGSVYGFTTKKINKNYNNNNKLKLSSTPLWPHSNEGNSTVVSISAVKSGPGFLTRAPVIRGAGGCGLSIKAICSRDHLQGTEATCWPLMIRTPTLSWSSGFLFCFSFLPQSLTVPSSLTQNQIENKLNDDVCRFLPVFLNLGFMTEIIASQNVLFTQRDYPCFLTTRR